MTFYQIVFLFFAYSFLGWVGEVLFTAVVHRKYQDRGVLSGPLCLLYGVGGLVITFALGDIREGWFFLLVFSAVYATVIEWIGGHILEYTTHTRWWDYSAMPFNLDGYVCLGASLTWGAEETVTKNVAVTVVNLGSNALTVDNDAIAPFTAVVNGTTVTVTPPAPNTTSDDIVRTMTVSVAGGNSREVTLTQFAAGSGGDTKGIYTSMSQFIPASTSTTDRYYPSNSTIDGQPATGFKLGTSSLAGVFTSEALGASLTGDKKLSFYAVAWTGKAATVYIRVNNGGAVSGDGSHAITASAGATGSGNDFTFTDVTDSDYYTFQLTGLTAASTVTISTSPDFTAASDRNTGRAIVLGVQVY